MKGSVCGGKPALEGPGAEYCAAFSGNCDRICRVVIREVIRRRTRRRRFSSWTTALKSVQVGRSSRKLRDAPEDAGPMVTSPRRWYLHGGGGLVQQ